VIDYHVVLEPYQPRDTAHDVENRPPLIVTNEEHTAWRIPLRESHNREAREKR